MAWRRIESAPDYLKDGRNVLALIPCYGYYNDVGKLRGYLPAIVSWKYGQWNETGMGKREPAFFQEIDEHPPLSKD